MFHRPRKGSVLVVGTPFPHPTVLTRCLWGVLVLASHVNGSYAVWPSVSQAFPESFGSQSCPIKNHCFRHKAVPGKASSSGVWVVPRCAGLSGASHGRSLQHVWDDFWWPQPAGDSWQQPLAERPGQSHPGVSGPASRGLGGRGREVSLCPGRPVGPMSSTGRSALTGHLWGAPADTWPSPTESGAPTGASSSLSRCSSRTQS